MPRYFKLDLTRGFDSTKPIPPPIRAEFTAPRLSPAEMDALHDYDEVGDIGRVGIPVSLDWDYLLARLDFTKSKWWLIERDSDESGEPRVLVSEVAEQMVDDVLGDFVDLSDDPIQARLERLWLKRTFRDYDKNTYRLGKDPRFKGQEPPPLPDAPKPPPPEPPKDPQLNFGI